MTYTATEAWKELFDQLGVFKTLSPMEAKVANRERLLYSPVFGQCYFDRDPVSWEISNKLQEFLELVEGDQEKASQLLIDLVPRKGNKNIVNCKMVLDRLRYYARTKYLTPLDRVAIFNVFSNTADMLSKAMGPPEPLEYTVSMMCCGIAQDLIYPTEQNLRLETILNSIKHGTALSWIMFLVRVILMDHYKINVGQLFKRVVLNEQELTQIQEVALTRIRESLDQLYKSSDPVDIFICWYELSEDKEQVKNWVDKHIQEDENLVHFTKAFMSIDIFKGALQWRVQKSDLENFVDIDNHEKRLRELVRSNCKLKETATFLLKAF